MKVSEAKAAEEFDIEEWQMNANLALTQPSYMRIENGIFLASTLAKLDRLNISFRKESIKNTALFITDTLLGC